MGTFTHNSTSETDEHMCNAAFGQSFFANILQMLFMAHAKNNIAENDSMSLFASLIWHEPHYVAALIVTVIFITLDLKRRDS